MLQSKHGMVRSVDVARHLDVSKPSVSHAVATLKDGGFLTMDEDYFLHLTDIGREGGGADLREAPLFHRAPDCRRRGPRDCRAGRLPH